MSRGWVLLILALAGCDMLPASSEGAVNARNFGQTVLGRTVDFYAPSGTEMVRRGSERFLPGNRTVLLQDRCYQGSWERSGNEICFTYPDLLLGSRHCYALEMPITANGIVTMRSGDYSYELRDTNRTVPAACPQ